MLGFDTPVGRCGVVHPAAAAQFSRSGASTGYLVQITGSRAVQLIGIQVQIISRITGQEKMAMLFVHRDCNAPDFDNNRFI
ncbi:hypothetical protein [Mycobacterium sp.]|uniref:hypothetical protein n=1 Tax=Mycobacterium sp. TaxID=1785 RepID=UPI003BAEEC71